MEGFLQKLQSWREGNFPHGQHDARSIRSAWMSQEGRQSALNTIRCLTIADYHERHGQPPCPCGRELVGHQLEGTAEVRCPDGRWQLIAEFVHGHGQRGCPAQAVVEGQDADPQALAWCLLMAESLQRVLQDFRAISGIHRAGAIHQKDDMFALKSSLERRGSAHALQSRHRLPSDRRFHQVSVADPMSLPSLSDVLTEGALTVVKEPRG